ncbi:MAG: CHAT domain-containing protein [Rhodospirillales bacterium]|nr:CHAT domain-containing protein [Rhodospirillales bacterium]
MPAIRNAAGAGHVHRAAIAAPHVTIRPDRGCRPRFRNGLGPAVAVLAVAMLASACAYDVVSREEQLFMNSRYQEIVQRVETRGGAKTTAEYYTLCISFSKLKRYDRLFDCIKRMEASIAAGDRTVYFNDASYLPRGLLSQAYIELARYDDAIKEALAFKKLVADMGMQSRALTIEALGLLGLAQALKKDTAAARATAAELADIGTYYPFVLLETPKLTNLARIYVAVGEYEKALTAIGKGEEEGLWRGVADLVTGASMRGESMFAWQQLPRKFMLHKSQMETGRTAQAKAGYDQLLANPLTAQNGDVYWLILFDRGRIALKEGDRNAAIGFFRKAAEVIESQRSTISTEASKIGFVGDKQDVYSALVGALFDAGRQSEALEFVERSKARALVDLLAQRSRFQPKRRDAAEVNRMLVQLASLEAGTQEEDAGITPQVAADRRRALADTRQRIEKAEPEMASLVTVPAMSSGEMRGLLAADEALIDYFVHRNALYAFVMTRDGVRGARLDGAGLADAVALFRASLTEARTDNYREPARRLYDRLIRPIEGLLDRRNLVIVPHGALHYLPFAALRSERRYLIDGYTVRLLPSASVLKYLRPADRRPAKDLLVLGNPNLGDRRFDLPGAETEAREIGRKWPDSLVLLRDNASETAIKKAGQEFRILHLASHGRFDSDAPLESGILLAPDAANDGRLTVSELYDLHLNADLVTLSACETGLGAVRNGDDVVGLTRGFLYAGARSIVSSLWPVSDQATTELMAGFYANLRSADVREALRRAQIAAREKHPHPFFWAAFQLTGSRG